MKTHREKKVQQGSNEELRITSRIRTSVVGQLSARAQQNLESLPEKVLEQVKLIHRYLAQGGRGDISSTDLRLMLDDIGRSQELDEETKDEILNDGDTRNVSISQYPTVSRVQVTNSSSRCCVCSTSKVSPPPNERNYIL